MKKQLQYLISGSLFFASMITFAQPTLTATGMNPVIGESFTFNNGAYVSPGSSGTNQTWDLSAISGSSGGLTNVVTPSATTNGASYPNSNVAWDNTTAGSTTYYKTSSTALQIYGFFVSGVVFPYSNPEDLLRFPVAYNNTYTDTWATQFVSSGYTWYRKGSTTVTADGYGTLITPTGTYTNVMRVHFVQTYKGFYLYRLALYY